MARKITKEAIEAFMSGEKFKKDNTSVEVAHGFVKLRLHGNAIAQKDLETGDTEVTNAGWFTTTTKERLNGIPGVSIYQRKGVWYLNGAEWDGEWKKI